jgi:hypothetical protein
MSSGYLILGVFLFLVYPVLIYLMGGTSKLVLFFLYCFVGIGLALFFSGIISLQKKYMIENIPTSRTRGLAVGFVELYGKAVPGRTKLTSPLTKRECVYFSYRIVASDMQRSDGNVASGSMYLNFYLQDESGSVLVNMEGAKMDISPSYDSETLVEGFPDTVRQFCLENMIAGPVHATESIIAPNDKIYVLGTAARNPYYKEDSSNINQQDKLMIQKANDVYYISDKHETKIISELRYKSVRGLAYGMAITLVSLAILFKYHNIL